MSAETFEEGGSFQRRLHHDRGPRDSLELRVDLPERVLDVEEVRRVTEYAFDELLSGEGDYERWVAGILRHVVDVPESFRCQSVAPTFHPVLEGGRCSSEDATDHDHAIGLLEQLLSLFPDVGGEELVEFRYDVVDSSIESALPVFILFLQFEHRDYGMEMADEVLETV